MRATVCSGIGNDVPPPGVVEQSTSFRTNFGLVEGSGQSANVQLTLFNALGNQVAQNTFNLVGRIPALNWITYHAENGGYDVEVALDERTARRSDGRRKSYRFQVQGPNAMQVIEKVLGQTPPELRFFHMTTLTIAGRTVRALRHGMAGQPGWELFGPWEEEAADVMQTRSRGSR